MRYQAKKAPPTANKILARDALRYQEFDRDQLMKRLRDTIRYQSRAKLEIVNIKRRITAILHVIQTTEIYSPLSNRKKQ